MRIYKDYILIGVNKLIPIIKQQPQLNGGHRMNYIIYTDGSCKPDMERAAYSYIIRTKKKCVKIGYASYAGRHILGAEISAVREAIRYLVSTKRLTNEDTVKFFIDSLFTLKAYSAIIKGFDLPEGVRPELVESARPIVKAAVDTGAKLYFNKVDAHQDEFNTNKVCDSLAKLALSYNM